MRYIFVLVSLIALLAVACGGDGAATPTPTATVPAPTPTPRAAIETLAFIRDGDILLVNADGTDERSLHLANVASFSWVSPTELDVVTGDQQPRHLLVTLPGDVRELSFPARGSWSADGQRYVVPVGQELAVFDREGRRLTNIAVTPPAEQGDQARPCGGALPGGQPDTLDFDVPVFAPDGGSIFVAVNCMARVGANTFFKPVIRVALDGTVLAETSLRVNAIVAPRFSPDGRWLAQPDAFHRNACAFGSTLVVVNAAGADAQLVGPSALLQLAGYAPAQFSGYTPAPTPPPVPSGGIMGFDWSPDSDAVVVGVDVSLCRSPALEPEPYFAGLYIVNLDRSEERLLNGQARAPAWSPSGDLIAYASGDADAPQLRVIDRATQRITELGFGAQPAWQPRP